MPTMFRIQIPKSNIALLSGALIPMGQGGHVPPIFMKGDVHGNVSPNMLEFLYFVARFILSSNINNCCLLYFNANITCSFTKQLQLLGDFVPHPSDPLPGLRPWTPLEDFRLPDPQSSFLSPPIIL